MTWKTKRTMPLPEPADATFTVLLQETTRTRAPRRRAWAQLIDHPIAGEREPAWSILQRSRGRATASGRRHQNEQRQQNEQK